MKTFVVGDIHGANKALVQCLERSGFDKEKDKLICLGDVCDGWTEVYEAIETLLTIKHLVMIRGNHDEWFTHWLKWGVHGSHWTQGADATAKSYAKHVHDREIQIVPNNLGYLVNLSNADIPQSHQDLLNNALNYYLEGKYCYVHGGFNRHEKINEQHAKHIYYWDRDLWMVALSNSIRSKEDKALYKFKTKDDFERIFIGHTSTINWKKDTPMFANPVINTDTGAGFNGKLTIMNVDTLEYFQSDLVKELYPNEKGR